jgi:N-acetylated-alpha-linked acidic dipeptidase
MIWLNQEDRVLLERMASEISREVMARNWRRLVELAPLHPGSTAEERAIQFLRERLQEYGLKPRVLRYDAYVSEPKYAKLEVMVPEVFEVECTPYRQVGTTGPEGLEGEVVYISPEEIGRTPCEDKIVIAEQRTAGDWMGLRDGLLLRLQEMGVRALIVIEQDSYRPDVVHQRADFSVSGNPTSDNIGEVQTIPAIVHVTNRDGARLRELAVKGGMRARVTSVVETGWRRLPLLVAEIRGVMEPNRFLLVNGHVDTPPFSPGVTDNASGCAAILELARILGLHSGRLRRSVRFAIWTGHETGRYAGSTWYNDAFWHDLRYGCVGSYNIDSPGAEGATTFRAAPISEVQEVTLDSISEGSSVEVEGLRWPTRAGDGSFWGTGVPHVSLTSSRPRELYDPHVNYSGGGWWWHTPHATMERGDVGVLEMDVRVELSYVFKMLNCPLIPYNFVPYAEHMLDILEGYQGKASGIGEHFTLEPVIERAREFRLLAERLEEASELAVKRGAPEELLQELNRLMIEVSRRINPVAHSNAGPTEQMTMETFGATPFPRIHGVLRLSVLDPASAEFKLLATKLLRQRNAVEDGFYQANTLIEGALTEVEDWLRTLPS